MSTQKIITILLLMLFAVVASAKENPDDRAAAEALSKVFAGEPTRTLSNIGNWGYWVRYDGQSAHDPNGGSGGFYPRGTAATVYQDGIIWGGFVNDDPDPNKRALRVGGQTYVIGTTPGWIQDNGERIPSENERVRMYRIRRDWRDIENAKEVLRQDAAEIFLKDPSDVTQDDLNSVWQQYKTDWEEWPADLGAPFEDRNGDGVYDPEIDRAGLANADQVVWFVVNDLDPGNVANLYGSDPIGIELQVTLWGYNQPTTTLGQILFKKYTFINKSNYAVDSMFVAQWSDPDVGTYTDDLAGCDVEQSIGFAYSGFRTDGDFASFGLPPAAVGYDFFQGPLVPAVAGQDLDRNGIDDADPAQPPAVFNLEYRPGYVNLPMTSFLYFAAGSPISDPPLGDYEGSLQWYNMLNGYTPTADLNNPVPYTAGAGMNAGDPTKYPLSGDPFLKTGDVDGEGSNFAPGDRRIGMASGPFTLAPGDTQEVVVALVGGIIEQEGGDNRNAVAQMKLNDRFAQFLYDNLFADIPRPPVPPTVTAVPLEDEIVLEWGTAGSYDSTEAEGTLGFEFEGYNIYQLPSRNASLAQATKIATFDKNNGVQTIRAQQFLPSFGDVITVPIQQGTDSGIKRSITIDRNFLTDQPLFAGNSYYFAVTAYNYNPDPLVPEPSLESEVIVLEVVPQGTKPGDRFQNMPGDNISVSKTSSSTGAVQVTVVNPEEVEDKEYSVTFSQEPQFTLEPVYDDSTGALLGYDTLGIWHKWNLLADGTPVLQNQTNLSGDFDYTIVDGLLIQVQGPKTFGYAAWDYDGTRWVSGTNAGGVDFFGGLFPGYDFFGSTLGDPDLRPVQLVFQDQADVDANGYASEGAVYRRDQGYAHVGTGQIPFAAYDVTDPASPRRLNISFVENDFGDGSTTANLIWDMGWDGSAFYDLGAREYIFIHNSDYNGGVDYDDTNFAPSADVLWAIWPSARGSHPYLEAPFTMDIIANIPNKPSDSFSFSTEGFIANNTELAKADVEKANVFPNPYYAYNPEEPSRFERFVTFNHLPQKATIRIFDLSGTQVRKLEKNTDSQFFRWNLRNESDLPVASGMYIAHIDMPDLGKTKVLKVMVIMGQEVLRFY